MVSKNAQKQSTDGAALVSDLMAWMQSFIAMPAEYTIVAALYAVHSYVYRRFDTVPYLSLTSAGPQAGKTTLMQTVCALADHGEVHTDPTKATLFAMIDEATEKDRNVMIGWDECEKAARESDERREVINSGYLADGTVPRINRKWTPDSNEPRIIRQKTFCPKILAGIGSLAATVRDRSIVLLMRQGKSERRYLASAMKREAETLRARIEAVTLAAVPKREAITLTECEWLDGREADLWMPLFTTARYLGLNPLQMQLLHSASDLLIELKHADPERRYTMLRKQEDRQAIASGAEPLGARALRAIATAFQADETRLPTATIIERMHAADAAWRDYRGTGLTPETLASLVATAGLKPLQFKPTGARKAVRGYALAKVTEALAK